MPNNGPGVTGTDTVICCQSDEAYQVGKGLTPVGAYLAQDEIIRVALEHGVDMIHPGSGLTGIIILVS
jgi:pyruvate carboxylase